MIYTGSQVSMWSKHICMDLSNSVVIRDLLYFSVHISFRLDTTMIHTS